MTVGQLIRDNAARAGLDLSHLDDHELGVRLASMPAAVADDQRLASIWMRFGMPSAPRDRLGQERS